MEFFFSSNIDLVEEGNDLKLSSIKKFGFSGYTYGLVASTFFELFRKMGYKTRLIEMPEIYSERNFHFLSDSKEKIVHIRFSEINHLRVLRGAYNIAVVFWEFDGLDGAETDDINPFQNQIRMLKLFNEIWVGCSFTKQVFVKNGIDNVFVIPSPVKLSEKKEELNPNWAKEIKGTSLDYKRDHMSTDLIKLSPLAEHKEIIEGKYFLSILNIHDFRKDYPSLIRAFEKFSKDNDSYYLIIKTSFKGTTADNRDEIKKLDISNFLICRLLPDKRIKNERIIFVPEYLSKDQLQALISRAAFYISTSAAEGQNLPLIESMAEGKVVIAPQNTAMLDYINDKNAIIIPTVKRRVPEEASSLMRKDIFWNQVEVDSLYETLLKAIKLNEDEKQSLSKKALETVKELYSYESVGKKVKERIDSINLLGGQ